ncbi:MAG: PH domain-containing protein [Clostridiaceae bacterium]
MEKYSRNHFITVIDDILKNMIPFIIIFWGVFKNGNILKSHFLKLGIFIGIIALALIYDVVKWRKKKYCLTDNKIMVREGVFIAKRREIPFSKIQTINVSQNIKQRIFKLASIKIDTGSSIAKESEINIVIKKQKAEKLKHTILNSKEEDKDISDNINEETKKDINEIKTSGKDLFVASLTNNAWFAGVTAIFAVYNFLGNYLGDILEKRAQGVVDNYADKINFDTMAIKNLVILIIFFIFIYLIFSVIISMILIFIKYYDFSIKREGKNIVINYGLFEKKNYVMPVKKISAVYIKQNLFRQMIGLRELHIETVGYGDEKGESSILFPIANLAKQKDIIKTLLPEFYVEDEFIKVPKRALKRFIKYKFIFTAILSVVLSFKFTYGFCSFILVPILVYIGYREYKNSGIYMDENIIGLSFGTFNKVKYLVLIKRVQSMQMGQNYFQRKLRVFNFQISIQGNIFGKTIGVRNFSEELQDKLIFH